MDKIDTEVESYTDIAKEGIPYPDAVLFRIIVAKINEIVEWINTQ